MMEPYQKNAATEEVFLPDNCPSAYFNGFAMTVGSSDVIITLQLNGKPTLTLNTSYTVAKTLSEGLKHVVDELERATQTTILTTQKVVEALSQPRADSAP